MAAEQFIAHLSPAIAIVVREEDNVRRACHDDTAARGHEFRFLPIGDLPLYNQDHDAAPPEAAVRLKAAIRAADAVMFVTPEYNRSIPGVLKNALDHASRPYGDSAWAGRPAGVLGASPGAAGTAMAQQHLRNVLAYLDMPTLGQPERFVQIDDQTFTADGALRERSAGFLDGWLAAFLAFVALHRGR